MNHALKEGVRVRTKLAKCDGMVVGFDKSGEHPIVLVKLDEDDEGVLRRYPPLLLQIVSDDVVP
jgi:hypothetical protein